MPSGSRPQTSRAPQRHQCSTKSDDATRTRQPSVPLVPRCTTACPARSAATSCFPLPPFVIQSFRCTAARLRSCLAVVVPPFRSAIESRSATLRSSMAEVSAASCRRRPAALTPASPLRDDLSFVQTFFASITSFYCANAFFITVASVSASGTLAATGLLPSVVRSLGAPLTFPSVGIFRFDHIFPLVKSFLRRPASMPRVIGWHPCHRQRSPAASVRSLPAGRNPRTPMLRASMPNCDGILPSL